MRHKEYTDQVDVEKLSDKVIHSILGTDFHTKDVIELRSQLSQDAIESLIGAMIKDDNDMIDFALNTLKRAIFSSIETHKPECMKEVPIYEPE